MEAEWFKVPGPHDPGWDGKCNVLKRGAKQGLRRPGDERCRRPAGAGTSHLGVGGCSLHGGFLPTWERSLEEQAAAKMLVTYGAPRDKDQDPRDTLLELMRLTMGHVDWLAEVISALDPSDLTFGVTKIVTKEVHPETRAGRSDDVASQVDVASQGDDERLVPSGAAGDAPENAVMTEVTEQATINAWLVLYGQERDRAAKLGADLAKLKLFERQVEIEEAQAVMLAGALSRTMQRLQLEPTRVVEAQAILREELALAEAGS